MRSHMMRAVMYLGPGKLELREVPVPEINEGEILLRIRATTTCGTDVKTYLRGHPKIIPPTIFGHELAGDIVSIGDGIHNFKPGMRVTAHNSAPCNKCFYCKNGQHNLCENLLFNFGSFAEYARIPAQIVNLNTFEIPEHLGYAQAALVEPLSTVVHGHRIVRIQPGERVAIIGSGGPIGLMHLQMALHSGATQVIAVDVKEERLIMARELGATATINPAKQEPVGAIRNLTDGRGADVAIESAGAKEAWQTALHAVRKGGRVLWFGGLKGGEMIDLDTTWVHYGEICLYSVFHSTPRDVHLAFELISSGVINTKSLISTELSLEQVEDALKMMIDGKIVKAAIRPDL